MPNNAASHDPWHTLYTIALFTASYNATLLLFSISTSLLFGTDVFPILRCWDWREYHFAAIPGYKQVFVSLMTSMTSIIALVFIVKRAKLVLDYVLTIQGLHLIVSTIYSLSIPRSPGWWFTWLSGSLIMIFGGEWACMRQELRPIFFTEQYTLARETIDLESN